MDEYADPEMSYRRGFAHGAQILYDQVKPYLSVSIADQVRDWMQRDIWEWRLKNLRGKITRRPGETPKGSFSPPDLKLR
jgi:hypothetical protein